MRTPTSSRKPQPSVLNQILNQPSSRAGSPDVLAMAAAAAAIAQAKTELKKDVCFCLFFIFSYVCHMDRASTDKFSVECLF